jgi:hypothetical protein
MHDIARNHTTDLRRAHIRPNALAGVALTALMFTIGAVALVSAAPPDSDSSASSQPAHPHKHRHLPTPAPTPMALPPDIQAKLPAYKAGTMPFHDGEQLIYQASWVGIPAAQARL